MYLIKNVYVVLICIKFHFDYDFSFGITALKWRKLGDV